MTNTKIITARLTFIAMLKSGSENELKSQAEVIEGTLDEVLSFVDNKANELMAKSTLSTDIRWTAYEGQNLLAYGSAKNGATIHTPTAAELEQTAKINEQFRKSAFSILNGIQVKKLDSDDEGSELEVDAAKGFNQDGIYASLDVLVISYVKQMKDGKETGAELRMVTRRAFQPKDTLRLAEGHLPIYLSASTKNFMGDDERIHSQVLEFAIKFMKGFNKYRHFIGGRKGVLVFCDRPFGGYPIHNTFKALNINRMEHLLQLVLARGIKLIGGESIPMPKIIKSVVADGIEWALTLEDGLKLGIGEGMYQIRSEGIVGKGTIFVSSKITESFTNSESIKVKDLTCKELRPEDLLFIGNSDSVYDMKISHQLGYVFVENFLEGKVKHPWGNIPSAIKREVQRRDKNDESVAIKAAAPVELSRLNALGFPKEYMTMPLGAAKTALKSLRPPAFKMYMLAIMPLEYLDRTHYKAAGIYAAEDPSDPDGTKAGDALVRIPFLAVGGGAQSINTKDAKGKSLFKGYSYTDNVIVIALHEPTLDKEGEVISYPDDVELGGNGASRILKKMITAWGADADGDRIARSTDEGDLMLRSAGIKYDLDVPVIKSKNQYKGIDGWSEEVRKKLWCISTPLLMLVGTGDKITRQLLDLAFAKKISLSMWKKAALAGSEVVQRGVIAAKYSMTPKYRQPFTPIMIKNMMADHNVGSGFDFEGALYQEGLDAIIEEFHKVYNDKHVSWEISHPKRKWEGGYGFFWDKLALFNIEMGDNWVKHVEDSFYSELVRMAGWGKEGEEAEKARESFKKLFRQGNARDRVRGYVAQFIEDHKEVLDKEGNFLKDNSNVWSWMLSHKFIRPDVGTNYPSGKLFDMGNGPEALPWLSPEGDGWKFRILEIMGMPFDINELNAKEERRQKALQSKNG